LSGSRPDADAEQVTPPLPLPPPVLGALAGVRGRCRRPVPGHGVPGGQGRDLQVLPGLRLLAAGGGGRADLVGPDQPGRGVRGGRVRAHHQVAHLRDGGERADHRHRRSGPARPAGYLLHARWRRMPA
jgi:hypothetical protein